MASLPEFGAIQRLGKKVSGGEICHGESAVYEYLGSRYQITPTVDPEGHKNPLVEKLNKNSGGAGEGELVEV